MIPEWTAGGYLPPAPENDPIARKSRSPHRATLPEFSARFGMSPHRAGLIGGLGGFRRRLYAAGFSNGVQWLNGSFVEDAETLLQRPPRDIDLVTFCWLPSGLDEATVVRNNRNLFSRSFLRSQFGLDHYYVILDGKPPWDFVDDLLYWFGVWSHQRENLAWKGFVEIPLDPGEELPQGGVYGAGMP